MLKKLTSLLVFAGGLLFAQTSDYDKDKLKDQPKSIEESFTKALIRANIIEGYVQEFHTKKSYNSHGNLSKLESFSENGELNYTTLYTYNNQNQLIKIETTNPEEDFVLIYDYEYNDNGYVVTKSENDVVVLETTYTLDQQNNILSEKELNLLDENLITERQNIYTNNQLTKTEVRYKNGGYTINYKYNEHNLPIEEIVLDLKKKLVSKKLRSFDEHHNLIEENIFDQSGKLKTNNRIKYEYDDKGNWTTRTQYANNIDQPISNSKRTIRY